MKLLIAFLILGTSSGFAQQEANTQAAKPAPVASAIKLNEAALPREAMLEIQLLHKQHEENRALIQRLSDLLLGPIEDRQRAIAAPYCKKADIPIDVCAVDQVAGKVVNTKSELAQPKKP